mmetsp:Transcript_17551/g.37271  ORF Transcript_17551/g.37271 Transcript_17551/m.37271 type:complete len:384 (-) Transcript_17551:329-1480(-)
MGWSARGVDGVDGHEVREQPPRRGEVAALPSRVHLGAENTLRPHARGGPRPVRLQAQVWHALDRLVRLVVQEPGGGQVVGVPREDVCHGVGGEARPVGLERQGHVRLQAAVLRGVAELHGDEVRRAAGDAQQGVPRRRGHRRPQDLPRLRRVGRQGPLRVRPQLQVHRAEPRVDPRPARPEGAAPQPQRAHVGRRAARHVARRAGPRRGGAQLPRAQRERRDGLSADGGAPQGARLLARRRPPLLHRGAHAAVRRHRRVVERDWRAARHAPRAAAAQGGRLAQPDELDGEGRVQGAQGGGARGVHGALRRAPDTRGCDLQSDGGEPQGDGRRQGGGPSAHHRHHADAVRAGDRVAGAEGVRQLPAAAAAGPVIYSSAPPRGTQ